MSVDITINNANIKGGFSPNVDAETNAIIGQHQNKSVEGLKGVNRKKDTNETLLKKTLSKLGDSTKGLMTSVLDKFTPQLEEFNESVATTFQNINQTLALPEKTTSSKGDLPATTIKPNEADVKGLNGSYSLPALFIGAKLQEVIDIISENSPNGKKSGAKKKSGNPFSNMFGGLKGALGGVAKGATSILILAGSLIAFAGAAAIFSTVDFLSLAGNLLLFTAFVGGAYFFAKKLETLQAEDTFLKFSLSCLALSGAFLAFGIALLVMQNIKWHPQMAITLGVFVVFIFGCLGLAKLVNEHTGDFKQFAIGSALLAGALAVFAIAIFALGIIPPKILGQGIEITIALLVLLVGAGFVLGKWSKNLSDFKAFGMGALLLSAGVAVLAAVVLIIGQMDPAKAWNATAIVFVLVSMLVGAAFIASKLDLKGVGMFAAISGCAILMGIAVLNIAKAAEIAQAAGAGNVWMMLGLIGAILVSFILITAVLGIGPVAVHIAIGAIVLAAIVGCVLLMTIAIRNIVEVAILAGQIPEGAIGKLGLTFLALIPLALILTLVGAKTILAMPAITLLLVFFASFIVVLKNMELLGRINFDNALSALDATSGKSKIHKTLQGLIDVVKAVDINLYDTRRAGVRLDALQSAIHPLYNALSTAEKLNGLKGQINQELLVGNVSALCSALNVVSQEVKKGVNQKVIDNINGLSMVMINLSSAVVKMGDFNDPTQIDRAKEGLAKIGLLIYDPNGEFSLVNVLYGIQYVSANPATIQALDGLVGIVSQVFGIVDQTKPVSEAAITNMANAGKLIEDFSKQIHKIKELPTYTKASVEGILDVIKILNENSSSFSVDTSNLKDMGKNVKDGINEFNGIKEKALENIQKASEAIVGVDVTKVGAITDSLTALAKSSKNLSELQIFASKAAQYSTIAQAFEKIANQVERINNSSAVFDSLSNIENGASMHGANGRLAGVDASTTSLQAIHGLLKSWDSSIRNGGRNDSLLAVATNGPTKNPSSVVTPGKTPQQVAQEEEGGFENSKWNPKNWF